MRAGKYLFSPLANPGKPKTGDKAEDWLEGRFLSSRQILSSLKLYGKTAGIGEEKLNLMTLRRTAIWLRLNAGDGLEEMQGFLDSQEAARFAKYRLERLKALPEETGSTRPAGESERQPPTRKARPVKPEDGTSDGLSGSSLPAEAVHAILAEKIQGIEEQIIGLRMLERRLFEQADQAENSQEKARLLDAYTKAAARVADLVRAEVQLEGKSMDPWEEKNQTERNRWVMELREELAAEDARSEALVFGEVGQRTADRRLVVEIAMTRLALRYVLILAREAAETGELIHLVENYSVSCTRLVRLLRADKIRGDPADIKIKQALFEAINIVNAEVRTNKL